MRLATGQLGVLRQVAARAESIQSVSGKHFGGISRTEGLGVRRIMPAR